ncbi:MAG: hypothetical protein K0B15_11035 [Lentimicrobium sp.]|nr:hypothetical protein [Lentimicrobium sp.]
MNKFKYKEDYLWIFEGKIQLSLKNIFFIIFYEPEKAEFSEETTGI